MNRLETTGLLLPPFLKASFARLSLCLMALLAFDIVSLSDAHSQSLTILHSFPDGNTPNDGVLPQTGLIQGSDGNFYGTTSSTAFKMTLSGSVTVLHTFGDGTVPNDGYQPSSLVQGSDGNFYGTTYYGGSAGDGTVFKITPSGSESILHSFVDGSVPNDGKNPDAALVQGNDGNFYGTTELGGSGPSYDGGTIFKITPSGAYTILHNCRDGSVPQDGFNPEAALVQGSDGNFYGTTVAGGQTDYNGTAFKMTPAGAVTILYSFEGNHPNGLVQGTDGNFYGTTFSGGSDYRVDGTVFKMTPAGVVTTLHGFNDGSVANDGKYPAYTLFQGSDGNFYGTTPYGGSTVVTDPHQVGDGILFKITPSGVYTIIHSFSDGTIINDGINPLAGLVQGTDGNFYGTTEYGGVLNEGTVFRLPSNATPQPTVTAFAPATGPVGTTVTVTGKGFTGTIHVAFNGVLALFTVNSDTQIVATVPTSANTGPITVATPTGVGSSSSAFSVIPVPTIAGFYPVAGPIGSTFDITGTGFTATTGVTLSGTAVTFSVKSDSDISVTVPIGATTGMVSVTTPGGTATSDSVFRVAPVPTITSFAPASGPSGTTVTLTGTGFAGTTNVRFNGLSAALTVISDTQITATVPSGAATGPISLTTVGGTATSASVFTVTPSAPMISSLDPTTGAVGRVVTLYGIGFTNATGIAFNGTPATVSPGSDTEINTIVPSGATTGAISITTPVGTATSPGIFTVVPVTTITSFTPASGRVGTSVVITGTSFTGATSVYFYGASASFVVNSDTQVTVTVPNNVTTGVIYVTSPGGTATSSGVFTVIPPAPAITSFTPTSGPVGTVVTVTGTNLNGVTAVRFHNASAKTFSANAAGTQLTVTVPGGAATGTITVTTPGGSVTTTGKFTVTLPPPTITTFTPTSGPVGTTVTITGTGFYGTYYLYFGAATVTALTVNSDTSITATVPIGATTSYISLSTSTGSALSANLFVVTTTTPTVTSFSPTSGPVGTVVTVTGTNLNGVTAVRFHNASAKTFSANASGTQLTVTVPSGAGTGTFTVTTPHGSIQTTGKFTITP